MPADSQGDEFRKILAVYNNDIATAGKLGLTSANKRAENVCMRLLNALYGWSLVNANSPAENAEAIDLIDEKNHLVIQVTTTCSADKINHTLRSDKTNEYHQKGYRLKFAFVGFQHDATKVQSKNGWTIHDPRGIGFNRKEDTLFTADLVDQFEQLGPDKREEILQLVHGDIGRIVSPTPAHAFLNPDVVERINARLIRQRENHPSFQLMRDDYDAALQPQGTARDDGRTIPNAQRLVKAEGGAETSFRDFVRDSWESGEQNHLFIIGRGGLGKTVALLTFATEEGFLPKGVPAVYIPLYDLSQYADSKRECVDRYLKSAFSEDEYDTVERLSHDPWCNGPNVILLFDGYNEIPADKIQDVNGGIRAWAERPGVQMVTTSRIPGLFGISRTQWLELQPISEQEVKDHLKKRDLPVPKDAALMRVLETPLMLKLYIDVESFSNQATANYLQMELSDSAGRLIWNYLQRELWQVVDLHKGDYSKIEYAAAILLTLPYVCWRMESAHKFSIEVDTLNEYIQDACDYWLGRKRSSRFGTVEVCLRQRLNSVDRDGLFFSQLAILENEAGLFVLGAGGYTLMHQSLRDGLAAIHLRNVMEAAGNDGIPEDFGKPISEYVKDFFADLCETIPDETNPLLQLWERARKADEGRTGLTNPALTHNLLRVIHKRFDGDLTMLDWSGMDLRGESLFSYRRNAEPYSTQDHSSIMDICLALSHDPKRFRCTALDEDCFRPQSLREWVRCVCFSPDGSLMVSTEYFGVMKLWDTTTGRILWKLKDQTHVASVCFSPDGSLLAGGTGDGTVLMWDVGTGRPVRELERHHEDEVSCVCFARDGSLLASASRDGSVFVWDTETWTAAPELGGYAAGHVTSVCFSTDGSLLAGGTDDGAVLLWDVEANGPVKELERHHDDEVSCVCFARDGSLLASGSRDGSVFVWDANTWTAAPELGGCAAGHVTSVCFSPDGSTIASGSYGGDVRVWNAETGELVTEIVGRHHNAVISTCFSPDGSFLAFGSRGADVRLWDATVKRMAREPSLCGQQTTSVRFSPDGTVLAGGSDYGDVLLWNASTGNLKVALEKHRVDEIASLCFSRDGTILAGGMYHGGTLLWDATTGKFLAELERRHDEGADFICFSPDGSLLASATRDGSVLLWDTKEWKPWIPPENHENSKASLSTSSSAFSILPGDYLGDYWFWQITVGQPIVQLSASRHQIIPACCSPNYSVIASCSDDGTIRLSHQEKNAGTVDTQCDYYIGTIEPLYGINVTDLNLSLALVEDEHDLKVLSQNGVIL